jgi:type IV pilus assembly protein PilY1
MSHIANIRRAMGCWSLALSLAIVPHTASAAHLDLPNSPLFTSSVEPNVMLLIDNSGSMNHIIWATGYDQNVTYDNWGYAPGSGDADYVFYNNIPRTIDGNSCSSGWKRGRRSGTSKCLKLPNPVGDDTRYLRNYLNYLFSTYDSGTDLSTGTIPNDYRMNVARTVATNFVNSAVGMRLGVSSFNNNEGGRINAACGSSKTDITTAISGLTAETWTPLSEALYEVTRYFRGLSSQYNASVSYTSPIQYRCQKNFTIVITDGLPTYDTTFPTDDPADVANTNASLPNWDGNLANDGSQPTGTQQNEGFSLYLDDIAKFANDIDMKTSGTDTAGRSFQDATFLKQNMNTYTIGFAVSNQMLQDAATYGQGRYFTATDAAGLTMALNDALDNIRTLSSAAAAVAANSTALTTGSEVFIAKFNSEFWSGTLLAAPIASTGVVSTPSWNSDTNLANPVANNRKILTYKPSTNRGIPFRWPADLANLATTDMDATQTTALTSVNVLNYLRGEESNEGTGVNNFRGRPNTKLGDIINSSPQYVGKPTGQYENPNIFRQAYMSADYLTFRSDNIERTPIVYVGANDGMLHGFDASTGADKGKEVIAFVPSFVYPDLKSLSDKTYSHKYFVDGSPAVADAKIRVGNDDVWRTVLVGGLNKGGQGIYALDVTSPLEFNEANASSLVLWEFSHAKLGYTFSRPIIVKTNSSGKWAAIFGNGYNNTGTGTAVLFVVDLSNGDVIKEIDTGVGSGATPNGLASVNGIDMDGNGTVDYIYGGDLLGNMWKFDVSDTNKNSWQIPFTVSNNPKPLYTAKGADGNPQPITTRPDLSFHPTSLDAVMVYFGTGKYLETADKTFTVSSQKQSFYAIRDNGTMVSSVTATRDSAILVKQSISTRTINGKKYRDLTTNTINWATKKGWYHDLPENGERVVGTPLLLKGIVFYSTFIPNGDPCASGGSGYFMATDYRDGSQPDIGVFDTNGSQPGFGNELTAGVEKESGAGGTTVVGQDGIPIGMSPQTVCDPADATCEPCLENDPREKCQEPVNKKSIPGLRLSWRELINK